MALLVVLLSLVAPALSRSTRARRLEHEATRLLAMTEYARDEAISQGVPMSLWIQPEAKRFGVEAKPGYPADKSREREFILDTDVRFDLDDTAKAEGGIVYAAEFDPDGTPADLSLDSIRLMDRSDSSVALQRADNDWGYEIVKGAQ